MTMQRYPNKFLDNCYGLIAIWLVIAISSFLITTAAHNAQGGHAWNHPYPMPRGVTEVKSDTFILNKGAATTPDDLCGHDVYSTRTLDNNTGQYVICGANNVTFNDHQPGSVSFGHAAEATITSPLWIAGNALFGFFLSIWPISVIIRVWSGRRQVKLEKKKRMLSNKAQYEADRAALGAAWANGDISMGQFEKSVQELVRKYT